MMTIPYALILIAGVALYFCAGELLLRFVARLWLQWRAQRAGADREMAAWGIDRLRLRRQSEQRIADLAPLTGRDWGHTNLLALDATTLEARRLRAADRQARRRAVR